MSQITTSNIFWRSLAVVQVFGGLIGGAYYFLSGQQNSELLSSAFREACAIRANAPLTGPDYTSIFLPVAEIRCILIEFFSLALQPPSENHTIELLGALPVVFFVLLLNSITPSRPDGRRSKMASVAIPLIIGLVGQLRGAGLALPIYWLFALFSQTGVRTYTHPDKRAVQTSLFATLVGIAFPTVLLAFFPTPNIIAAWQPFPIYTALAQTIYLVLSRGSHQEPKAGIQGPKQELDAISPNTSVYLLTQASFLTFSTLATLGHIPVLFEVFSSPNPLITAQKLFVPRLAPVPSWAYKTPKDAAILQDEVVRFLQWDAVFIGLSTWLAGVWNWAFSDVKSFAAAIVGTVVGSVILGPGAAIAGVWMWKSWVEEEARIRLVEKSREAAMKMKADGKIGRR